MVQTVVSFRCKVREERGKPIPHREPVGVAESPMAEIGGRSISAIRTRIDVMLLERGGQSAHAGGSVRQPVWRRARRRPPLTTIQTTDDDSQILVTPGPGTAHY